MKNFFLSIKLQKTSTFWIVALTVFLMVINLGFVAKRIHEPGNINLMGTSILSWATIFLSFFRKNKTLIFSKERFSQYLGVVIIFALIIASIFLHNYVYFLRILPLLSGIGIILLSFGIKGLSQCGQEIMLLGVLAIPEVFVTQILFNLPLITAKVTTIFLLLLGFDAYQEGVYVYLPTGGIEINEGCSGANQMFQLLRVSTLFLVLFPTQSSKKIWVKIGVVLVAVFLAFTVNIFRVSLLTFLVASLNKKEFLYWHLQEGSHIFSIISVIMFCLFWYFIMLKEEPEQLDSIE